MKAIVFDVETTDLLMPSTAPIEKQPKIIELGAMAVGENGVVDTLSQLINPGEEISAKITKITGIVNDDLVGKPSFEEFLPVLMNFFDGSDMLICHNAPFDSGVLKYELMRLACDNFPWPAEIICTVQEYVSEFGYRPKMTELYEKKTGKPLAQTHRALDDVRALHEALAADKFFEKVLQ